jgi:hypothetical protein
VQAKLWTCAILKGKCLRTLATPIWQRGPLRIRLFEGLASRRFARIIQFHGP